jgi:uncharacterized delta-60 repeat protein
MGRRAIVRASKFRWHAGHSVSLRGDGANDQVLALALQSDGKVLIGGLFTYREQRTRNRLARLNADGTLDTAFLFNAAGANYSVRAIAVQSDGRIVIGGEFGNYNGAYRGNIARVKPDGSLDETFINFNSGANGRVSALALQTDGKDNRRRFFQHR